MNPRRILAATAAVSYFWIVLAGIAEQSSDVENVKAASSAELWAKVGDGVKG
jgi:hypothetical protein